MSFMDEIRKIPPVTRFLCGSSLAVTLPVMLHLMSPYKLIFVKDSVIRNFELWRMFTSFFLGGSGLNYLFDFIMLYRNSNGLESRYFPRRSADYGWQLLLTCASILVINIPLGTFVFTRPLLLALTYVSSSLAPPGSLTSLFGLVTIPVAYFPYALLALDFVMAGPSAALASATGAVAGHLWWWGIWSTRALEPWGRAPVWLRNFVGDSGPRGGDNGSGVHVIPPRRQGEQGQGRATGITGAHNWGTGQRLGDS